MASARRDARFCRRRARRRHAGRPRRDNRDLRQRRGKRFMVSGVAAVAALAFVTSNWWQATSAEQRRWLHYLMIATAASLIVAGTIAVATARAPRNVRRPSLSGVPHVGSSLAAPPGVWSLPTANLDFDYKWQLCGDVCTPEGVGRSGRSIDVVADPGHRSSAEPRSRRARSVIKQSCRSSRESRGRRCGRPDARLHSERGNSGAAGWPLFPADAWAVDVFRAPRR